MDIEYFWRVNHKTEEDGPIHFHTFRTEEAASTYAMAQRNRLIPPLKVWVEKVAVPDYLRKIGDLPCTSQ